VVHRIRLGGFAMDWIKTRILLKKLEAQLRCDVLPDGDERKKLRKLIEACEHCLADWNQSGVESRPGGPNGERVPKLHH
jgi:hypothetical protein